MTATVLSSKTMEVPTPLKPTMEIPKQHDFTALSLSYDIEDGAYPEMPEICVFQLVKFKDAVGPRFIYIESR